MHPEGDYMEYRPSNVPGRLDRKRRPINMCYAAEGDHTFRHKERTMPRKTLLIVSAFFILITVSCRPPTQTPTVEVVEEIWVQEGEHGETWRFGYSVATAGDVNDDGYADVIIGAPEYSGSGSDFAYAKGLVQVYYGSISGLGHNPDWIAVGEQYSHFGWSVGSAGDVNGDDVDDIIVGAPSELNPNRPSPVAYVYHGSRSSGLDLDGARPMGNPSNADWVGNASPEQGAYSGYGHSVASAGDVNNDGIADVIVGAPSQIGRRGWAYVYHGSDSGLSTEPDWMVDFFEQEDSLFGYSVATAGDVNGDGYSDVVVGAPGFNEEVHFPYTPDIGAVFLYHGSSSGLNPGSDWEVWGPTENMMYGHSVATAGNVNGDEYSDVIVGYPRWASQPQTGLGDGKVDVYYGSAEGLDYNSVNNLGTWADWSSTRCNPTFSKTNFGWSVATAGNPNGDKFSDIIIGAPLTHLENDMGQFCVFYGSERGLPYPPLVGEEWYELCNAENARMGWSVASAGDVNGDGCDEVIIGAPDFSASGSHTEGRAYVYFSLPCSVVGPD
jgi:hypothetical protein